MGNVDDPVAVDLPTTTPRTPVQGLFDLQGRRIIGTPTRGIYVKEGKKYVVK